MKLHIIYNLRNEWYLISRHEWHVMNTDHSLMITTKTNIHIKPAQPLSCTKHIILITLLDNDIITESCLCFVIQDSAKYTGIIHKLGI